jgi:hypothetical protein
MSNFYYGIVIWGRFDRFSPLYTPRYHTEALYNRMLIALLLHKKEEARRIFKLLDKSQFSEAQLKKVEGYLR